MHGTIAVSVTFRFDGHNIIIKNENEIRDMLTKREYNEVYGAIRSLNVTNPNYSDSTVVVYVGRENEIKG